MVRRKEDLPTSSNIDYFLNSPLNFLNDEERDHLLLKQPYLLTPLNKLKGKLRIPYGIEKFERYKHLRSVDVAVRLLINRKESDFTDDFPIEKIGIVGPPQVGKTTLSLCLRRILDQNIIITHLDIFSQRDEHAMMGKPGWSRGGRKRPDKPILEGEDIISAQLLLDRLKTLRSGSVSCPISLADTPRGIRDEDEWFHDFYMKSLDSIILLGRNEQERAVYALPYVDQGINVFKEVHVYDPENQQDINISKSHDIEMIGEITPFNVGTLSLSEEILRLSLVNLEKRGLFDQQS